MEIIEGASYYYKVAAYLNKHPEELSLFFTKTDSLEVFANIFSMMKAEVRAQAIKIASRLILKIAKQIADTGYRSGKLKLIKGIYEGSEIELDHSLEYLVEQPEQGILGNIVSLARSKERNAFIVMLDNSYSMKGMKVILAAITAAAIAQHFKQDYAILAFNNKVSILKAVEDKVGPEEVIQKLFALELNGDTDVRQVLEAGLKQIGKYERKQGLILTDGAWNLGGDPLMVAAKYSKLSVIGFPPAKQDKVRKLAELGRGECSFVQDEKEIASAIIKCLN